MRKLKVFDHVGNETSSFVYEELSYYLKRLLGVSISKTDRYSQADIHLELMPNTGNCVESKKINDEDRIYAELHRGIAKLRGSNNISLLIHLKYLYFHPHLCSILEHTASYNS